MKFKKISIEDQELMTSYFERRNILSCEYSFITLMIWSIRYHIEYAVTDDFMLIMEEYNGHIYGLMPVCEEIHFEKALKALHAHFDSLGLPLKIYVADEIFATFVQQACTDCFEVTTNRDEYDYLYEAKALRTLLGKKLRKKRNHINAFLRDYEGRWVYRELHKADDKIILDYFNVWYENKDIDDIMLDQELQGIKILLKHVDELDYHAAGIFIDDELKAFTMGSLANNKQLGLIHIEKADTEIRGLYPMINQQFLINTFPHIELVNREDDVGDEGLRKSKLSYYPMDLAKKFTIEVNSK